MSPFRLRPLTLTAAALTLAAAGCTTGPLAPQGRYFQYQSTDHQVVAEYLTADTATCQRHLANMKQRNIHGSDAVRCSATSAAARLPIGAAVNDPATRTDYSFRFASMELCQRMLPAIVAGPATLAANCRR